MYKDKLFLSGNKFLLFPYFYFKLDQHENHSTMVY